MNFTIIKKLPPIKRLIQSFSLSNESSIRIEQDRNEIKQILAGEDKRLLFLVGPCSAWPKEAVLEFGQRLAALNNQVKDALKIVMRVYIQKPRTIKGWSGPVNQPDPFSFPTISEGLFYAREMMVKVIELGLPIADEAVYVHNAPGFLELLSWMAIGARSSENQEHRLFASGVDIPVGLKNPTHGSLAVSVNSLITAQHSHVTFLNHYEIKTHGNAYAHLVLRGSNQKPNYSVTHLNEVKKLMDHHQVKNPSVIIDASHDNCFVDGKKDHRKQLNTVLEVAHTLKQYPELKRLVKGFMVESFLKEGNQNLSTLTADTIELNGLSITDPCLGWEQTEDLILRLADIV